MMRKSNMTGGNMTGAAKNMTGNMSGKAMVAGKVMNKTG